MTRLDEEYDPFDPLMIDETIEEEENIPDEMYEYHDDFDEMYNIYNALQEHCKNNALFLDETSGFVDFADFIQLMIPNVIL